MTTEYVKQSEFGSGLKIEDSPFGKNREFVPDHVEHFVSPICNRWLAERFGETWREPTVLSVNFLFHVLTRLDAFKVYKHSAAAYMGNSTALLEALWAYSQAANNQSLEVGVMQNGQNVVFSRLAKKYFPGSIHAQKMERNCWELITDYINENFTVFRHEIDAETNDVYIAIDRAKLFDYGHFHEHHKLMKKHYSIEDVSINFSAKEIP